MKRYIYYSTIFSICTEAFLFRFLIDLKLFYLFVLINFTVIIILNKAKISKSLLIFYGYLLMTGFISVLLGTNHMSNVFAQFFGIFFISLYFFNFFKLFSDDVPQIFRDYVYLCFGLGIVGIPIFMLNLLQGRFDAFHSLLNEPAHYSALVLPACYYSFKNRCFPRYIFFTILSTIILSGSSVGIIGVGIGILLIPERIKLMKLVIPTMSIILLLAVLYNVYPSFRLRVDDTSKALIKNDLSGVNLSTYALLSNLYVSYQSFVHNPVLGSGLGSHELTHDKYLSEIQGIEAFEDYFNLNSKDANSLFLRIASDLGLIGLVGVSYFICSMYTANSSNDQLIWISRAILLYFFCKLFREGHYFSPEMYFFVFLYYFNFKYGNHEMELEASV